MSDIKNIVCNFGELFYAGPKIELKWLIGISLLC